MGTKKKILLLALLFLPTRSYGLAELGIDLILSKMFLSPTVLQTHNYLFLGGKSFALGAVFYFDRPQDNASDMILGAGVRFGEKFFFELDGGILIRKYENLTGRGLGGGPIIGWQISRKFRVSIPFTVKYISSGLAKRWHVSYVPYFGFRVTL